MRNVNATVVQSFSNISSHFKGTFARVQTLGEDMTTDAQTLQDSLSPLDDDICQPLAELRDDIQHTALREYEPTGDTPEKITYAYPTDLPRTGAHEEILAGLHETVTPCRPSPVVLPDIDLTPVPTINRGGSPARPTSSSSHLSPLSGMSLREVNPNVTASTMVFDASAAAAAGIVSPAGRRDTVPMMKASGIARSRVSRLSKRGVMGMGSVAEGVENVPPSSHGGALRNSTRRKSPRLH
jgi:kinesin family protein 11